MFGAEDVRFPERWEGLVSACRPWSNGAEHCAPLLECAGAGLWAVEVRAVLEGGMQKRRPGANSCLGVVVAAAAAAVAWASL